MPLPSISIVIPTLNRSHLLRSALRSAVLQDYPNVEIVVFDDASDDETEKVAREGGDRVTYVRSRSRVDMTASFEAALRAASGDFVTFLTDDSYLLPNALSRAIDVCQKRHVDLVVWRHAGYFDEHWVEPARRQSLYIPIASGTDRVVNSQDQLRMWLSRIQGRSEEMPRSINSLCRMSVVRSGIARQGTFFMPPAPDHSSGISMLMNTERYVALDEVLVLDGVTKESVGPAQSFTGGKAAREFYRSLNPGGDATYLDIPTTSAIVARSFERALSCYDGAPRLDERVVFRHIVDDLAKLQVYGSAVGPWFHRVDLAMRTRGLRGYFAIRLWWLSSYAKWTVVRLSRLSRRVPGLERLRGLRTIRGSDAGFGDIEGAAAVFAKSAAPAQR
jgi:hypothetical protein